MTTIVAVKDGKKGVVIASDLQCSAGGQKNFLISKTGKWCISDDGDWAFGYCGRVRTANILHSEKDSLFLKLKSPEEFIVRVHNTLSDYGVAHRPKDEDGVSDRHDTMDTAFILTDGSRIWKIFMDYSVLEVDKFAADGSGGEFALGALTAMNVIKAPKQTFNAIDTARLAVECAAAHDIYSGMGVFVSGIKSISS